MLFDENYLCCGLHMTMDPVYIDTIIIYNYELNCWLDVEVYCFLFVWYVCGGGGGFFYGFVCFKPELMSF